MTTAAITNLILANKEAICNLTVIVCSDIQLIPFNHTRILHITHFESQYILY